MNTDLFLELTFAQLANSQAARDIDKNPHPRPELGKYDTLADARDWRER